jgi:sulfonate transport system permease protein
VTTTDADITRDATDPDQTVASTRLPEAPPGQGAEQPAPAAIEPSAATPRGPAADSETFQPEDTRQGRLPRLRLRSPLGAATTPLVLLALWQVACWRGWLSPAVSASPVEVVRAAVRLWRVGAPATLGEDLRVSLTRALLGLLIGGGIAVVAATFAGLSRLGEQLFNGPVQILNTVPFLALLPLMIMWVGIGDASKIALISISAGLPVYINLFSAIRGVDPRLVEMALAAGASRRRLISRVLLPGALPGALVGLRFALSYSVLGLVVAEQINANSGIGFMISQAQDYDRLDEMFLGLVIYALLGLAADQLVRLLERLLLTWRPPRKAAS